MAQVCGADCNGTQVSQMFQSCIGASPPRTSGFGTLPEVSAHFPHSSTFFGSPISEAVPQKRGLKSECNLWLYCLLSRLREESGFNLLESTQVGGRERRKTTGSEGEPDKCLLAPVSSSLPRQPAAGTLSPVNPETPDGGTRARGAAGHKRQYAHP